MSKPENPEEDLETRVEQLTTIVKAQQQQLDALHEAAGVDDEELVSRRSLLQGGASVGAAGLLAALASGSAAASPGADGDTVWGSQNNRDDWFADFIDANTVQTEEARVNDGEIDESNDLGNKSDPATIIAAGNGEYILAQATNADGDIETEYFTDDGKRMASWGYHTHIDDGPSGGSTDGSNAHFIAYTHEESDISTVSSPSLINRFEIESGASGVAARFTNIDDFIAAAPAEFNGDVLVNTNGPKLRLDTDQNGSDCFVDFLNGGTLEARFQYDVSAEDLRIEDEIGGNTLAKWDLNEGLDLLDSRLLGVRSESSAISASDLNNGEIAMDESNGRLVWKDSSGSAYYVSGTSL